MIVQTRDVIVQSRDVIGQSRDVIVQSRDVIGQSRDVIGQSRLARGQEGGQGEGSRVVVLAGAWGCSILLSLSLFPSLAVFFFFPLSLSHSLTLPLPPSRCAAVARRTACPGPLSACI